MPVSFIECFNIKLSLRVQTSLKDFTNRQITWRGPFQTGGISDFKGNQISRDNLVSQK